MLRRSRGVFIANVASCFKQTYASAVEGYQLVTTILLSRSVLSQQCSDGLCPWDVKVKT